MCLETFNQIINIVESIFTIAAIVGAGLWFYLRRQKYPRALLSQDVIHYVLDDKNILLHIDLTVENSGNVLLSFESGEIRIQQIMPLDYKLKKVINSGQELPNEGGMDITWPLIKDIKKLKLEKGEFEIEPKEQDKLHFDFILDSKTEIVRVYSYLKNISKHKKEIGWHVSTIYKLEE